MSTNAANVTKAITSNVVADNLRDEAGVWLFVLKTLLAYYLTGWLTMRFELSQPTTALLTVIIVANRHSGMVLAKSFYRAIGTIAGAVAALLIVSLFPQQRVLFLLSLSLWIGLCVGGATLYRNFKSYAFVLAGYTAAIIAVPVVDDPTSVFAAAVARLSEVMLAVLVSGAISDTVFPSHMRDVLRSATRAQFAHFIGFVQGSTGGKIERGAIENAHLRFVRDAVTLEDLRSSVIFEDPEARARSSHMQLFNQRFMAASTSFQSLHHLINRLQRGNHPAAAKALVTLYAPLGSALDAPIEAGAAARVLLPRLQAARASIEAQAPPLYEQLDSSEARDFNTGAQLLNRFVEELYQYVESAASLQSPKLIARSAERVSFARGNDLIGAGMATIRAVMIMLALGTFWIGSSWPSGGYAVILATVFSGLFATAANAARITTSVVFGFAIGTVMGFICTFFVLPLMDGYTLFVAASEPFVMIGLVAMMRPALANIGLGYSIGLTFTLSIKNMMKFDPAGSINDAIAQLVGLSCAAVAFFIIPPAIGSLWLRRRQMERLRRQVTLAAEAPLAGLRARFESVNHDLFSQVVSQTEQGSSDSRALIAWALAVHETGRALIELRNTMQTAPLSDNLRHSVDPAIDALARFYEQPSKVRYLRARDAVNAAIETAHANSVNDPLLDDLHLIRFALLDCDSVLADYIPATPAPENPTHAS